MNKKMVSMICYITFVGWLVAFLKYKKGRKSSLEKYHLEQSLGLSILVIVINIVAIIPVFFGVFYVALWIIINFLLFVIGIAGIITAYYDVRLPLPIIGSYFENKFRFIE